MQQKVNDVTYLRFGFTYLRKEFKTKSKSCKKGPTNEMLKKISITC
jgi:hypothetical protein